MTASCDLFSAGGLLAAVRCPNCRTSLRFTPSPVQPLPGGSFGVLSCSAHSYPVVDSIPIIRTGRVSVQEHHSGRDEVVGPTVAELVDRLGGPDPLGALIDLLAFPPALPLGLDGVPVLRLPLTRGPGHRAAMARRRQLVRRLLTRRLSEQTAQDWLALCHLRSRNINPELYPYFLGRFGQPRYLASLSLTRILGGSAKPLLDLACGFGHIMHHLAVRAEPLRAVGVDRNFFQLWVARRFVAPAGGYVCADALRPLPFADDAFCAAMCTDSFHLFPRQEACFAELQRCAENGTVILDRVGNGLLEPHDVDTERPPRGYVDLAGGRPHRILGETELIDGYLAGHGPQLAAPRRPVELDGEKWLSLITSDDPGLFVDHGAFDGWPHGEGPLGINPAFRAEHHHGGGVRLLFEFSSTWFAFENARMRLYTSAGERLSWEEYDRLRAGRPTSRTGELVNRFVLLGMPLGYAHPPVPDRA